MGDDRKDAKSDLQEYLDAREEYLNKLYHNPWPEAAIEKFRKKTKAAADRAQKIREEWGYR